MPSFIFLPIEETYPFSLAKNPTPTTRSSRVAHPEWWVWKGGELKLEVKKFKNGTSLNNGISPPPHEFLYLHNPLVLSS